MASYPGSAAGDAQLYISVNNKTTTLTAGIDAVVTTIPVASTSGFPASGFVTVDLEIIAYTSIDATNFLGATRASDGSTAVSHSLNAQVSHNIVAAHHNASKDEIIAVEADLVPVQAALTPVAAASTATSILNRISQIVHRFILLNTATSNWYDTYAWLSALNQTTTLGSTAASLKDRLDQIVTQIKSITGMTNWYDAFTFFPISKGGTNSGTALNNNRIIKSSGGAIIEAAAITGSRALASDANGIPVHATTTAAELDFVSGVTSALQTQLNAKASTALSNLSGTSVNTDINMNTHKLTGLSAGTAAGDSLRYEQLIKILQVVQTTSTTQFSTTNTAYQSTNLTGTITPSSTSSKIFIFLTSTLASNAGTGGTVVALTINGTANGDLSAAAGFVRAESYDGGGASVGIVPCAIIYQDSPASVSAQTYTAKIKVVSGTTTAQFGTGGTTQVLTLVEVL